MNSVSRYNIFADICMDTFAALSIMLISVCVWFERERNGEWGTGIKKLESLNEKSFD